MSDEKIENWAGIILCGGRAVRMGGQNKATLRLGNRNLLDIAILNLSRKFDFVALCPGGVDIENLCLPTITDHEIDGVSVGPASALLAALEWAAIENLAGIITLPVDTPILPESFCARLISTNGPAYAQHNSRNHWLHAAWPIEAAPLVRSTILKYRKYALHQIHNAIGSQPVKFLETSSRAFHNINSPNDLTQLKVHLGL